MVTQVSHKSVAWMKYTVDYDPNRCKDVPNQACINVSFTVEDPAVVLIFFAIFIFFGSSELVLAYLACGLGWRIAK